MLGARVSLADEDTLFAAGARRVSRRGDQSQAERRRDEALIGGDACRPTGA